MLHARAWLIALILVVLALLGLARCCLLAWRSDAPRLLRRPRRLRPPDARRLLALSRDA